MLRRGWPWIMLVGGEPLTGNLPHAAPPWPGLTNLYGPTETTIWSAVMALAATSRRRRRLVVRSGTRGFMSWTLGLRLLLRGLLGSFTLRVLGLRGAIGAVLG